MGVGRWEMGDGKWVKLFDFLVIEPSGSDIFFFILNFMPYIFVLYVQYKNKCTILIIY
jgi:hypothetical protein